MGRCNKKNRLNLWQKQSICLPSSKKKNTIILLFTKHIKTQITNFTFLTKSPSFSKFTKVLNESIFRMIIFSIDLYYSTFRFRMGSQECVCRTVDAYSSQPFKSSTGKSQLFHQNFSSEHTDIEQEYDNPSRSLFDHNFLKTELIASHNRLELTPKKPENQLFLNDKCLIELESGQKCQQNQSLVSIGEEISFREEKISSLLNSGQKKVTNEFKMRKMSIESKIPLINLQQKDLVQPCQTTSSILRSLSGYILSQKNLFEPIKIAKENFIKCKNQDIHGHYSFLDKLGEGSYGKVYKVQSKLNGEIRAAKIIKRTRMGPEQQARLMNEIDILRKLDHPNIIKIYEVFLYENLYCIITQFCEGGSLFKHFRDGISLTQESLRAVFKKIFSALSYMHRLKIVHRDIKLDNIVLVNRIQSFGEIEDLDIRIIDFGLAKVMTGQRVKDREKIGTYTYMAPEVLKGVYSSKCDLWSTGIMLCTLLCGENPFKKHSKQATYQFILKADLRFEGLKWRNISDTVKDLLVRLLTKDINQRISASEAYQHPFLKTKHEPKDRTIFTRITQGFLDYHRGNNLVSVIQSFIAYMKLTQKEVKEFSHMFQAIDTNCDGFIEAEQLRTAFSKSGHSFQKGEIDYVLGTVNRNHSGKIDYSEFVTILCDRKKLFAKASLKQAFIHFDVNNNGYLQREELKEALKQADQKELLSILQDLDENNDDKISEEQFIRYLEQENLR